MNHETPLSQPLRVAVIGGGPAGLMAAEILASATSCAAMRVMAQSVCAPRIARQSTASLLKKR